MTGSRRRARGKDSVPGFFFCVCVCVYAGIPWIDRFGDAMGCSRARFHPFFGGRALFSEFVVVRDTSEKYVCP
jgi:hypothetical protein